MLEGKCTSRKARPRPMREWSATRRAGTQSQTSPTSARAAETMRRIHARVTPSPTRMDRQNASIRGSLVRRAKDLVEGGLHLLEPIREGNLAGERDGVSDLDLLGNPRLAEERGHEEAVSSTTVSSTICMWGRGRLSWTLSTRPTTVASCPTSAKAILLTRLKSR